MKNHSYLASYFSKKIDKALFTNKDGDGGAFLRTNQFILLTPSDKICWRLAFAHNSF
jgi:hypothetical protein